ncbi:MAG: hypothetical protein LWX83_05430 [Anaerolineae bacterium]|nr:hypothetical protein [Anaerolineae bacterium]
MSKKYSWLFINILAILTMMLTAAVPAAAPVQENAGDFKVEINQALGIQYQDAKNFVAGKPTAILAYFDNDTQVDESATRAVVIRDGSEITTLSPKTESAPVKTVEFLCPDMETCGDWQAGSYEFEVTVNGSTVKTEAYTFTPSKQLRVLAVNVVANYGGTITNVAGEDWKSMDDFTKATYPVTSANMEWIVRDELDASDNDLETEEGRLGLWEKLAGLVPNECQADPTAEGCYDMVVGFISDRPNGYPNGTLQGYTYGRPATIVVASDEDARGTVAHEIAHVYGIGDTYAGGSLNCNINPSPDGMNGSDWENPEQQTSCTMGAKQFSEEVSATLIDAAASHPYEVGGRGLLPDMACFMGSGGIQANYWVTPEVYDHLFKALSAVETTASGGHLASLVPAEAEKPMLYYFGYVKADGSFESSPWYTFDGIDMEEMEPSVKGEPVTVKVLDENEKVLASQVEKVDFYPNVAPGDKIVKADEAPLEGAVDFPEGANKVQLIYNDKVIHEVSVSANKPQVSDVSPVQAGQKLDGKYKITWKASDADGDKLSYIVEFNPDINNPESEWWVLGEDLTQAEGEEDLSQWPGGKHAQFRVTASDGLLATEALSKEFVVPVKAPEAEIFDPEWGTEYAEGEEILLEGEAYDLQDDWLEDKALVWSSDKVSKPLGYGEELVISLPVGTHTITLTAKNSQGLESKAVLKQQIVVK